MRSRLMRRRKFSEIQTNIELNEHGWFSVVIPAGRENLIKNPSLETNANGYVAKGGTIARTDDWQSHGAISLAVTPTAGVNDGFYYDDPNHDFDVAENTLYWPSFDFKGDGGRKYKAYVARQYSGTQLGAAKPFTATGHRQRIEFPYREGDNTLVDNLISYWKLGEATAATRLDSVNTNHLTPLGGANPGPSQTTGIIGNAAQFTVASSEYLNIADNASLSVGNIDFSFSAWVYLDDKAALRYILSKGTANTVAGIEHTLRYDSATDRFQFQVSNGAILSVATANNLGSPSLATWYFIVAWYDSVNDVVGIQVNNGTPDTTANTTGSQDTGGAFRIGSNAAATGFWNGRIDEVGFWKRVLTTDEKTALYNGGFGQTYNFLQRRLYVVKDNETNTRPFYVDGLQFEAGDFPTTLLIGDMVGLIPNFVDYYWTGAPHASTSARVANSADGGRVMNLRQLGLRVKSHVGLGMIGLLAITTPLGNGGSFPQGVTNTEVNFNIIGEISGDEYQSLDMYEQALVDAFNPKRVSPWQPCKILYEPLDDCGNSIGETLEIAAIPDGEFMPLQTDNLNTRVLALPFKRYLPFVAKNHVENGTTLSYNQVLSGTGFVWRDEEGNWIAETLFPSPSQVLPLPDGTLLLLGQFVDAGGDTNADYICRYDPVTRIFSAFNTTPLTAGGGGGPPGVHRAILLPDNDTVIFVGNFLNAGGDANADMVAKLTLSTGLFSSINATPLTQTVHVIVKMNDGNYAIGGRIENAGGDANADRIAKINSSTFAYSAFNATPIGAGGFIFDIKVESTGNLIAAGTVTNAGGIASADYVFRVNATTGAFSSLSSTPLNAQVSMVAIRFNGDLVLVGLFTDGNGDVNADYAIGYNGTSFYTLAGPAPFNAQINFAATLPDGTVGMGGPFASIGTLSLYDGAVIHNGSTYIPLDFDLPAVGASIGYLSEFNNRFFASMDTGNGIIVTADITEINNPGSDSQSSKYTFRGPGRIVSLKNLTTGKAIYFNLTLVVQEEAVLILKQSGTTFGSNLRPNLLGTIINGSNTDLNIIHGENRISLFVNYTARELNDTNNNLSGYTLQGVNTTNSDNGRLYVNFVHLGAGNVQADFYKDSARTQLVAQSTSGVGAGVRVVSENNGSGISGFVTNDGGAAVSNSTITIDVPVASMSWSPAYSSISGAVRPRIF